MNLLRDDLEMRPPAALIHRPSEDLTLEQATSSRLACVKSSQIHWTLSWQLTMSDCDLLIVIVKQTLPGTEASLTGSFNWSCWGSTGCAAWRLTTQQHSHSEDVRLDDVSLKLRPRSHVPLHNLGPGKLWRIIIGAGGYHPVLLLSRRTLPLS